MGLNRKSRKPVCVPGGNDGPEAVRALCRFGCVPLFPRVFFQSSSWQTQLMLPKPLTGIYFCTPGSLLTEG